MAKRKTKRYGVVKYSAEKARKFRARGGTYSPAKELNVKIRVRRVRYSGTYPQPPYMAEACFRTPTYAGGLRRKFDRCADGRGASPTVAIAQAMTRLASVVR